jgi:hypothetical protein
MNATGSARLLIASARPLRSYTRCADGFRREPDHSTIWRQKDPLAAQSIVAIRPTANEVPSEESVMFRALIGRSRNLLLVVHGSFDYDSMGNNSLRRAHPRARCSVSAGLLAGAAPLCPTLRSRASPK